jgi:small subunit ribosomal protein S16
MLVIRLARKGTTNDKKFRVIVQEKTKAPKSSFLEILGHYNPQTTPHTFVIKKERYDHWVKMGAQPSDTVASLVNFDPEKHKNKKPKKTKKQKAAAQAAKEAAAAEAEAKAAADKAAAEADTKNEKPDEIPASPVDAK